MSESSMFPLLDREPVLERGRDARFVHESHDMHGGRCRSCGMRAEWKGAEDQCGCRWLHERRAYEKKRVRRRKR